MNAALDAEQYAEQLASVVRVHAVGTDATPRALAARLGLTTATVTRRLAGTDPWT